MKTRLVSGPFFDAAIIVLSLVLLSSQLRFEFFHFYYRQIGRGQGNQQKRTFFSLAGNINCTFEQNIRTKKGQILVFLS